VNRSSRFGAGFKCQCWIGNGRPGTGAHPNISVGIRHGTGMRAAIAIQPRIGGTDFVGQQ